MPSKIKRRGKNSFLLTVHGGYDAQKKQITYTKTVICETQEEAENQYILFAADCLKGKVLVAGTQKMTLAEFYQYWKQHHAKKNLEKTTIVYNDALFDRIEEGLGHLKIDKVLPRHILEFIDQISAPGMGHNDTTLSGNTVRKHYNLLKTLFNAAEQWEFIINNPMDKVTPPKKEKVHKKILNEEEMSQFLGKLAEHKHLKHHLWVILAFSAGLRREEIFGLQWQDINLDAHTIAITRAAVYVAGEGIIIKDTKSDNSYRTLSIPPKLVTMLEQWRDEVKAATKRRNKRRKIVTFDDPVAPEKWVFPQFDGSVGHPHSFNTFLRRFHEDNGLQPVSPHLLRHMMGSYLLKSGTDLAAVSEKLGHSNKAFTANTYIHALQSAEKKSAETMQNILDNLTEAKKGQAQ